ncbi:GNAT family N-acetyltransferase, partial [Marinomonas sp. MED121]|uniref:GNAT family N-acetyltransferase n=1 Tax=Marinomonas sp. MED121 TaxID=314277 RepID=UPI00055FE132
LYQALLDAISKRPIKNLLAIIALPNDASIALHEKIGMKKVAHFEKVGYKFGQWVDVGYWQMSLPDNPLLKE